MTKTVYKIEKQIIPNRLIYNKKSFNIVEINSDCVIENYFVHTIDDKIEKVILESEHPNCDPETGIFCLPERLYNKKISSKKLDLIEKMFETFNVDNCYQSLWHKFKYNQ